jgi:hypothetical protein
VSAETRQDWHYNETDQAFWHCGRRAYWSKTDEPNRDDDGVFCSKCQNEMPVEMTTRLCFGCDRQNETLSEWTLDDGETVGLCDECHPYRDLTPTTAVVRHWCAWGYDDDYSQERLEQFDRWLAAEIAAERQRVIEEMKR